MCTLNYCVVTNHCNIAWISSTAALCTTFAEWTVKVQQTACFWCSRRPWPHCSLTLLLLTSNLIFVKFCWSPGNLLNSARSVPVSSAQVSWIASWAVLMSYRVSTRERLEEGGELCRQWAGRAAEGIQSWALAGAVGEEKTCWLLAEEFLISLGSMLAFKPYKLSSKLQLHFRCICSAFPNCFSSSRVCNLILSSDYIGFYWLLFSSFLIIRV